MKLFRSDAVPREIADPKSFVGPAHTQRLASDRVGTPVGIYRVDFEDGGRTNWHTHSGPQWLLIVEGHVRVQKAGEPCRDVAAGDAIVIEPGEKHWHGAVPGSRGTHLAVNVDVSTDWLEPVSDDQYNPR